MLIATADLRAHLLDPAWVIFDCRHDLQDADYGARGYREAHLPGAHFASIATALSSAPTGANGRHPLPRAEDFAAFLAQHGVTADSRIVAYDDAGGPYAARFWWLARWIGLTQVAVLDGGLPKWVAGGHPVSSVRPVPGRGLVSARPDPTRLVDAAGVLARVQAGTALVIDARPPERFRGNVEPVDPVAGHIPTARNRPFKANLNPDLTLRPATELKRELVALLGGWAPADVIHQCGSGITACANLLAMEHAGLPGSKLYAGSWSEWIADPTRPVARGF